VFTLAIPWEVIDRVESEEGGLELRRRGEDFLITVNGRVLMNSRSNRSELALAQLACGALDENWVTPRVLLGGLGMGCTLRAALDALPTGARVEVSELNPHMVEWCRGPLTAINREALEDPRVEIRVEDVVSPIQRAAHSRGGEVYDAILLDLYEGPHAGTDARNDPFYGRRALARSLAALGAGGILAIWSEAPNAAFSDRLRATGFEVELQRPGRGGLRHAIYLARRSAGRRPT
jgi:spermidine synthase